VLQSDREPGRIYEPESVVAHDHRRDKGANLIFLNIQKLQALTTLPGEDRTGYRDRGLRGFGIGDAAVGSSRLT
jgi:hypothetical protein